MTEQITTAVTVTCCLKRMPAQTTTGKIQNDHLKIPSLIIQLSKTIPLASTTRTKNRMVSILIRKGLSETEAEFRKKSIQIRIAGVNKRIPDTSPSHQVSHVVRY